jgi:hypothetical protein
MRALVRRDGNLNWLILPGGPAVTWSDDNFDNTYQFAWSPSTIPTLIVGGPNVMHRTVDGGAHFP